MTRTLDFSPDMDSQLQVLAAQRGASVEAVLFEAAKQLTNQVERSPLARALELRNTLAATIQAGTRTGGAQLDAAAELRAIREERFADAA